MGESTLAKFSESLATLGVDCHRMPTTSLPERIEELVTTPAVGTELPFAPDALADTCVETDPTPQRVATAATGVTPARFGIAESGSLAIPSTPDGDEPISLYPSTHVAVVPESDVYADFDVGFDRLIDGFAAGEDSIVFATGPSATADMGGLVRGVHGPGAVEVIVVTDE